jgi:MEMO1 family protein
VADLKNRIKGAAMSEPEQDKAIRRTAVAGLFYPADPSELKSTVENLLAHSKVKRGQSRICALIVPHAGYVYSGPVAAEAFALLRTENHHAARVVIIGPSHTMLFQGIAASSAKAFVTPLGEILLDTAAILEIANLPSVVVDDEPHTNEHALEVELPFLQTVLGAIRIVPLLVGSATRRDVAAILRGLWHDDTLIVVSSDLSHYLRYENARRCDCATAEAIERLDETAIDFEDACGALPIRGLLIEAKRRGLSIERLDLRNSGDTAGDRNRVVGYGAWAIRRIVAAKRVARIFDSRAMG